MNADGSNQIQLTKSEGGYPKFVSPDGSWVYFESGLHETLWRVAVDGSTQNQISDGPALLAAFSSDGNRAAYLIRQQPGDKLLLGLMSIRDAKLLKTFPIEDKAADVWAFVWAKDNQSFEI
jgi:hypothetical protein